MTTVHRRLAEKCRSAAIIVPSTPRIHMRRHLLLLLVAGLFVNLAAASARAVPIEWVFEAFVVDASPIGSGTATSATTFTGSILYESTTPNSTPGSQAGDFSAGLLSFRFQIGGDTVVLDPLDLFVQPAGLIFRGSGGTLNGGASTSLLAALFLTGPGAGSPADILPMAPPSLTTAQGALVVSVLDAAGNGYVVAGGLTSLSLPEPTLGVLLGVVLLVMRGVRRR